MQTSTGLWPNMPGVSITTYPIRLLGLMLRVSAAMAALIFVWRVAQLTSRRVRSIPRPGSCLEDFYEPSGMYLLP